jgi:hypothetical protein
MSTDPNPATDEIGGKGRIWTVILVVLLAVTAGRIVYLEWTPGPLDREGIVRGRDFLVFYVTGWMVRNGEADRLYDPQRLLEIQQSFAPLDQQNPTIYLFYPPIVPLMTSPLSRMPYEQALAVWWSVQAACFLLAGWLLSRAAVFGACQESDVARKTQRAASLRGAAKRGDDFAFLTVNSRQWRLTAWLALAAFYPVWDTVLHGQLAAVLLLVLTAGLCLHRRGRLLWAGLVLSLLAAKPQYFAGAALWLLLRRDWRTVAAMAAGLLGQLAAVAVILGPSVLVAYVEFLPTCAGIAKLFTFLPSVEHGVAGIAQEMLLRVGCPAAQRSLLGTVLQALVAIAAGWMLFRVIAGVSPATQETGQRQTPQEYASAVLFMLLLTPHVLTYDLVLLAVPLIYLWSSSRWRLGVALYLATSVLAMPVYDAIGFSLVPLVLLAVLYRLATTDWATNG